MHDSNRPLTPMELRVRSKLERLIKSKLGGTEIVRDGFGHTVLKFRKKSIVMMGAGHDQKGIHLALKADRFTQDHLIQQGVFTRTPYIGQHGWVSLSAEKAIAKEWKIVERLLLDAYTQLLPKKKENAGRSKNRQKKSGTKMKIPTISRSERAASQKDSARRI